MELIGRPVQSWRDLAAVITRGGCSVATPFQGGAWLSAWYDSLPSVPEIRALPIEISEATSGRVVAAIPLIVRKEGHLYVVEFADTSLTDYNAPLIADGLMLEPAVLVNAMLAALPPLDILRLVKMPKQLDGKPNPLAFLSGCRASEQCANFVRIDTDWSTYQRSVLEKKFRKEMERSLRVFEREGENSRFELIEDADVAEWVLADIEVLQETRIEELGLPFILNDAPYRRFYRNLVRNGLRDGSVVVSALRSGSDVLVAGLVGIRSGDQYAMVRLGQDGHNWRKCSPGKLVIERTMWALHQQGVRHFDFTTGNYDYKNGFRLQQQPLVDVTMPLSMRGRVKLGRERVAEDVKSRLRHYPRLYGTMKRMAATITQH